jgi:hypothetical protein
LTDAARQLNRFTSELKTVRSEQKANPSTVRETQAEYPTENPDDISNPLFSDDELNQLAG